MNFRIPRRDFIKHSASIAAVGALGSVTLPNSAHAGEMAGRIRKALKLSMIKEDVSIEDKFRIAKDAGFEGIEPRVRLEAKQADEVKAIAAARDKIGLEVHGIVGSSNPNLKSIIDQSKMLGATSCLHVVGYDKKISYQENWDQKTEIVRRAVEHAEKNEIMILIENVWASFLIEPTQMARFIDQFDSPFVQVYFDIGNVVRWGWPQHWLEVIGKRARKLDVKEFDLSVAMKEGMRAAFDTPLGEGSIEWNKVRAELLKLDYRGWATAEVRGGDRVRIAEISEQMDAVFEL